MARTANSIRLNVFCSSVSLPPAGSGRRDDQEVIFLLELLDRPVRLVVTPIAVGNPTLFDIVYENISIHGVRSSKTQPSNT